MPPSVLEIIWQIKLKNSGEIELAFIYGSVAKDEDTAKSDVDLLAVGEIDEDELHELVSRIEKEMRRTINYTPMSKAEYKKRLKNNNPFY